LKSASKSPPTDSFGSTFPAETLRPPRLSHRGRIERRRHGLGAQVQPSGPDAHRSGRTTHGDLDRRQDDNVKVSSIVVEHPPVNPALADRFDFRDRSIAFSGDTAPLDAVAMMARRADVLVHETMYVPAVEEYIKGQIAMGRPVKFEAFMAHMKADHTPSEDVGRIAQKAGVKTLVLSHLTPAIDSISDDSWRAPAAKYFKGDIIVGKDLMVV
jgi:ribonuclease BN (tRNA processing enzyme)